MTETPAVTLYGTNKKSPHWYPKRHVDAKGVHTWVSSYADHFGYGYWRPDQYGGSGVNGFADHHLDKGYGPQYRTKGKYLAGDQIIQLSKDKNGAVMRRRTIATGGKLGGALHNPKNKINGYGHQQGYGGHQQGYGFKKGGRGHINTGFGGVLGGYGGNKKGGYGSSH